VRLRDEMFAGEENTSSDLQVDALDRALGEANMCHKGA